MKHIKEFNQFIDEGTINPDEVELNTKLQTAMLSTFSNVKYGMNGKDDKYYDYNKNNKVNEATI